MPSAFWQRNQLYTLRLAGWIGLGLLSYVLYLDVCNFIFRCGCRSLWAGATTQCNIHQHGVKHCPICLLPTSEYLALFAMILIAQGLFARRGKWLWATLSFPVIASLQAIALGLLKGYWS